MGKEERILISFVVLVLVLVLVAVAVAVFFGGWGLGVVVLSPKSSAAVGVARIFVPRACALLPTARRCDSGTLKLVKLVLSIYEKGQIHRSIQRSIVLFLLVLSGSIVSACIEIIMKSLE